MGKYQAIFRSRWQALFWAATVLVSAYMIARPATEVPEKRLIPVSEIAPKKDKTLEELIAEADAAEAARQEAMRQAGEQ